MAGRSAIESAVTRSDLVAAASSLFASRGYDGASIGVLASAAGVTRGALYHHFADKRALFEAVVVEMQDQLVARIASAGARHRKSALRLHAAVDEFLAVVTDAAVRQILLRDAPAVLGWPRWSHAGATSHVDIITRSLADLVADPGEARAVAHLVGAALIEAALVIADSDRPEVAREEMRSAIRLLLAGVVRAGPT